jgi:hypothetical protein
VTWAFIPLAEIIGIRDNALIATEKSIIRKRQSRGFQFTARRGTF